jgi:hypothetical protein
VVSMIECRGGEMTFSQRVASVVRRYWTDLLAIVGVSGLLDLLREFFRAKLMDFIASHFGVFGQWLVANPVALLTLGIVAALIFLIAALVKEAYFAVTSESPIVDHQNRPYSSTAKVSPKWAGGAVLSMVALIPLIEYGFQKYSSLVSMRSVVTMEHTEKQALLQAPPESSPSVKPIPAATHHKPRPNILIGPATTTKSTSQPPPPVTLQNSPGSAVSYNQQGGLTVGTLDVGGPAPRISFVPDSEEGIPPSRDTTRPQSCVLISTDKELDSPNFAVICDRACKGIWGMRVFRYAGVGGGEEAGSIPNDPNVAAFRVNDSMPSSVKFRACFASEDDKPAKALDVKLLILPNGK